jgi:predicted esterase
MPQLEKFPDLTGKKVFIANGTQDSYAPEATTETLVRRLQEAGAEVSWLSHPGGHSIAIDHVTQIAGELS